MSTPIQSTSKRAWNKLPILAILVALTTACWAANGCGTGVNTQDVRLDTAFDRTGSLRSDGAYTPMTAVVGGGIVTVGDMETDGLVSNLAIRAFVSVSLAAIPPGANVTKVVLNLKGNAPAGNPFTDFASLTVDHVNVVAGITKDNFFGNLIAPSVAPVPTLTSDRFVQPVELDVTTQVKGDIAAGRPISSFRFQFTGAPSADLQADQVWFTAPPNDGFEDARPFAIVTIQP